MAQNRERAIYDYVQRASAVLDRIDYYRMLNISSAASTSEVRNAYYRLAASLHPDVHGTAVEAEYRAKLTAVFSRVVEAYKILSKRASRERYDRELAKGNLRISMGADMSTSKPTIRDPGALKFFRLGQSALASGDYKSAAMNLRFALQGEPDNVTIQEALQKAEQERP